MVREAGQVVATEIRVPLSDREDLIREVVTESAELAAAAGVRLMDPQLGRQLTGGEGSSVAEQYMRTVRYAGQMVGLPEVAGAGISQEPQGFQPTTKFVVGVLIAFALLYFLMNAFTGALTGAGE